MRKKSNQRHGQRQIEIEIQIQIQRQRQGLRQRQRKRQRLLEEHDELTEYYESVQCTE